MFSVPTHKLGNIRQARIELHEMLVCNIHENSNSILEMVDAEKVLPTLEKV